MEAEEDVYRVELQDELIRVKLELDCTSFRPEYSPVESSVKLEDSRNEPERISIDETAELDDDMDMEDSEGEDMDNSASCGARKKKYPPFVFTVKQRSWFIENFTYSSQIPNCCTTQEEIASEYSKAHPESRPLPPATIGRIVKDIWGNKVRLVRRRHHFSPNHTPRKIGYVNLMKKKITQDQVAKLSESVFCLPVSELVTPGWTVEMFLNPFGIRYRRNIEQFYVDKQATVLEVYFSLNEECAGRAERNDNAVADDSNDAIEGENKRSCNASGLDSAINGSNSAARSAPINTDPVRTLSATILCRGSVISAEDFGIWDNKSVPTLRKVKALLEVISNSKICFGCDIEESWKSLSIESECLNPKQKVLVVHKSFHDIISNKGQRKLTSINCKILVSSLGAVCENCSHVFTMAKRKEFRNILKLGEKNYMQKNHATMTRAELEDKLRWKNQELKNCRSREKYLRQKLSELNGANYEDSTDSESSDDKEEDIKTEC